MRLVKDHASGLELSDGERAKGELILSGTPIIYIHFGEVNSPKCPGRCPDLFANPHSFALAPA